jgi:murein DD-endopeptidase MepM/ murein hydrolase activator NlpD
MAEYDEGNKPYGKTFANDPKFAKTLGDTSIDEKVTIQQVHKNINSLSSVLNASQGDLQKRLKSISGSVTTTAAQQQRLMNQIKMRELASPREVKIIEKSVQQVLGKLGYAVDEFSRGAKKILIQTAQTTKETIQEYGQAIKQDFYINKGNMLAMTLAKASPIFGYFAGKFMETSVFQRFSDTIKEKMGQSAVFVSNKMKDLGGRAYGNIKDLFSKQKQAQSKQIAAEGGPSGGRYGTQSRESASRGGPSGVARNVNTGSGTRGGGYNTVNEMGLPEVGRGGYVKKGGAAYIHTAEIVAPLERLQTTMEEATIPINKNMVKEIRGLRYATVGMGQDLKTTIMQFIGENSTLNKMVMGLQGFLGVSEVVKFFFGKRNKYSVQLSKSMNPMVRTADNVGVLFTNLMVKMDTLIGNVQLLVQKAGAKPITEKDTYKMMSTWTRFDYVTKIYKHLQKTGFKGIGGAIGLLKKGVLEMKDDIDEDQQEEFKLNVLKKLGFGDKDALTKKQKRAKAKERAKARQEKYARPNMEKYIQNIAKEHNIPFGSFGNGTPPLTKDTIAKLHEGEMVIPEKDVKKQGLIGKTLSIAIMSIVKPISVISRSLIYISRLLPKMLSGIARLTMNIAGLPFQIATAVTKSITKDIVNVLKIPMNMFNAITKAGGVGKAITGAVTGWWKGGEGKTVAERLEAAHSKEKKKTGVEGELQKIRHALLEWRASADKEWQKTHKGPLSLREKIVEMVTTFKESKKQIKDQWKATKKSYQDMREMQKSTKETAKYTKETTKELKSGITVTAKKSLWEKIKDWAILAFGFIKNMIDGFTGKISSLLSGIAGKFGLGLLGKAGLVGGAGYAGYKGGGYINKQIGELTGRGEGWLGDILYDTMHGKEKNSIPSKAKVATEKQPPTKTEQGGPEESKVKDINQPSSLTPAKLLDYYRKMNEPAPAGQEENPASRTLREIYDLLTKNMGDLITKKKEDTEKQSLLGTVISSISSGVQTVGSYATKGAAYVAEKAQAAAEYAKGAIGKIISPAPSNLVTSKFGPRNTGLKGASKNHKGVDLRAAMGSPIYSMMEGEVTRFDPKWGTVYVQHPGGLTTQYMHLSSTAVKVGDKVKTGQLIGLAGKTGPIPGMSSHLHFGLAKNGQFINPEPFLQGQGIQLSHKGGATKEMGGSSLNLKGVAGIQARSSMSNMSMMHDSMGNLGKEIGGAIETSANRTTTAIIKGGNSIRGGPTINIGGGSGTGRGNAQDVIASILNAQFA